MENQGANFGNNPQLNPYPNQAVPNGNLGGEVKTNFQVSAGSVTPAEAHYVSSQPNIQMIPVENATAREPIVGLYERLQKDAQDAERQALSSNAFAGYYGTAKSTHSGNIMIEILIMLLALFALSSLLTPFFDFNKTTIMIAYFSSMLLQICGFLLVAVFKVRSWASAPAVLVFVCQLIILFALILRSFGFLEFELEPLTDYLANFYL